MPTPTAVQLQLLARQIAERIGKLLEKRGLIERDMENAWLTTDAASQATRFSLAQNHVHVLPVA